MFKFDFYQDAEQPSTSPAPTTSDPDGNGFVKAPRTLTADEVGALVAAQHSSQLVRDRVELPSVAFVKVVPDSLLIERMDEAVGGATDLVPGVYEGGLKIWECTYDLVEYLARQVGKNALNGRRVCELGCGAGLPGIFAAGCGASVAFQDFNEEVLSGVTIPNLLVNCIDPLQHRFICGDWGNIEHGHAKYQLIFLHVTQAELMATGPYDVILTSETIYSPQTQPKLLALIERILNPQTGVVLVAAKTLYFGVGGGMRHFQTLVQARGLLADQIVWKTSEGVSREIMQLTVHTHQM